MITVHEHTYDEKLLGKKANILDIGCRGFLFTNHMKELGHHVIAVDVDDLDVVDDYYIVAISDHNGFVGVVKTNDPQATHITKGNDCVCMTLESFSMLFDIQVWDLIKMDVEGSEYEIIMNLTKAPAKQLSIEFHLHTDVYSDMEVIQMVDKLKSLGYEVAQHELTTQHGAGLNFWDSLFVL